MKIKLVFFILILFSLLNAQEIHFNKDSLYYIPSAQSYGDSDTLWMYNFGSEELIVDSAYSVNGFGYILESVYADSIVEFDYIYKDTINLHLPTQDSIMLIIRNPDSCPVCKKSTKWEIFQDTIIFFNNSVNDSRHQIFTFISEAVGIEDNQINPAEIKLLQNYPNPFNPKTTIEFYLPNPDYVTLEIFNSLGQRMICLYKGKTSAGEHTVQFNSHDFPSGLYLYRLTVNRFTQTRKMLLLK